MPEIQLLDQITIDKIAAGEVVERPSSVVKELVENSIDAGASAITVEIKAGGKELIRITDNGSGIPKDMVAKAFLRHSTSKLRTLEDLDSISTMGFRGEALSSISAVAQVEFITKTADTFIGCKYELNGGKEVGMTEVGVPEGTTILVKNLFYNTPARSKFLKSDQTEGNYIATLIEQLALSHPDISFQFISNGTVKLQTSGNGKHEDVIYQIYGRDIAKNLLPVSGESGPYKISGYVGKPVITRGNRNFECYFINGRYVQNKMIAKAIEDTYHRHTYLMQHQFPFVMLYFTVDGKYVDVNVHPAKREVRFADGEAVYRFVSGAIEEALSHKEMVPETITPAKKVYVEPTQVRGAEEIAKKVTVPVSDTFTDESVKCGIKPTQGVSEDIVPLEIALNKTTPLKSMPSHPEPFQKKELEKLKSEIAKDSPYEEKFLDHKQKTTTVQEDFNSAFGIEEIHTKYFKIIGQVFATYWIVEYDNKMYIIDQHAAHEKINYERFMKRFAENSFASQQIVPPQVLTLSAAEEAIWLNHKEEFARFGFEIEHFGGKEYILSAVPAELFGMNANDFFSLLLDEFGERMNKNQTPLEVEMKLATAACKASVKGGDHLTNSSAEALLKELFSLEDPYHCPHGRPTMTSYSRQELEKMFKRIV